MKSRVTGVKHWCEVCRTYTQPDAVSIRLHEQGGRHKSNARQALRGKLEDERDSKRSNEDLQRTLLEMDREARAAMQKDRLNESNGESGVASSSSQYHEGGRGDRKKEEKEELEEEEEEDGPKGLYCIRGVHYVMGEYARKETLSSGSACEVEIDGNWVSAVVTGSPREVIVPNTLLTIRYYRLRLGENGGFGEMEARPSSLRVIISEKEKDSMIEDYKRTAKVSDVNEQNRKVDESNDSIASIPVITVDENTGIGAWATVAVVEEKEDQVESSTNALIKPSKKRNREDAELDPSKALDLESISNQKKSFVAAFALAPDDEETSAMDFLNGSESYRGINLGAEDIESSIKASSHQGPAILTPVATEAAIIKPRKGPSGNVRRRREDD
jgi:hypothetical protein